MLRQVSSRNQRGKGGLKMKNALQICLVIAICIWLIYQMTHSRGKKKIFEEGSSKALFKAGERPIDVEKFSKQELSQMNKVEAIREMQNGDEEVEDEGEESTGEAREEEEEAGHEEFDEHDHDEAAQKREENEEASQAARERSFKADDASSAVAHVTQSNEPAETESENEAIWKNLDENAGGNNSSIVHQGISILQNHTVAKTVGAPMLHSISSQNKTTVESKNEGQQSGIRVSSTMNNQTAAGEMPVSVEQAQSPANLAVKVDPNNVTISQYQTTVVREQINTTKILSQEGEVPNLKTKRAMEQKDSETSSATNEINKAVGLEAGNSLVSPERNRDVNIDALSSLDIQSKAQSSKPGAMAA
ncbi:myb-like protein X [Zingiber officinale]|uniref:Uncharacterized protein n=1 Tax=Zingiber officinale TaxID=94328 RepID=A0A8J5IBY9_ZINOF|nr:myb-like protein X [Zingiber officinale]XP_042422815.1 myb-like protein X [Zingiber officinale]XP_042422824.1 myb-like protein X [Zingiber officinale]KAG6537595.1 hypothetical protein ZIOFF_002689 [Zingiber officinale]